VLGYGKTNYMEPGLHPEFSSGEADPETINNLSLILTAVL
jgi:hypothetical protein